MEAHDIRTHMNEMYPNDLITDIAFGARIDFEMGQLRVEQKIGHPVETCGKVKVGKFYHEASSFPTFEQAVEHSEKNACETLKNMRDERTQKIQQKHKHTVSTFLLRKITKSLEQLNRRYEQ